MPRIVVLDQVLKSWLFRFLTTKVDVIFILQKPNRFLFQFRFERAIACSCWRPYNLLGNSAGSNTPQAAPGKTALDKFRFTLPGGLSPESNGPGQMSSPFTAFF